VKEQRESEEPPEVRPSLGMVLEEITPELAKNYGLSETSGVVVTQVSEGSSAAEAGIRQGDIIVEIDQEPVRDLRFLEKKMDGYKKGDTALLLIKRRVPPSI